MSYVTGTYVAVFDTNPVASWKAIAMEPLSEDDLVLATSPDNKTTISYKEFEDGSGTVVTMNCSLLKRLNGEWKYNYNEDTTFPQLKGSFISIKKGNEVTEVMRCDDLVKTFKLTYTSLGMKIEVSTSAEGHVSTIFFKREDASVFGYYILDKHVNGDKYFESYNMSPAVVKQMMSFISHKVTDLGDGMACITDCFGVGAAKLTTFKFGEESAHADPDMGVDGVHLATQPAPGTISYILKDKKSGRTESWEGIYTSDGVVWSITLNGVQVRFIYKRYADIEGTWKKLTCSGLESFLGAAGVPKGMQQQMVAEESAMTIKHVGAGVWSIQNHSKVFPIPEIHTKFGEEVSVDYGQLGVVSQVMCLTKDGVIKTERFPDGKTIKATAKIGQNFLTVEEEFVGMPGSKAFIIFAKV